MNDFKQKQIYNLKCYAYKFINISSTKCKLDNARYDKLKRDVIGTI